MKQRINTKKALEVKKKKKTPGFDVEIDLIYLCYYKIGRAHV